MIPHGKTTAPGFSGKTASPALYSQPLSGRSTTSRNSGTGDLCHPCFHYCQALRYLLQTETLRLLDFFDDEVEALPKALEVLKSPNLKIKPTEKKQVNQR